jgi:hypothetical protein
VREEKGKGKRERERERERTRRGREEWRGERQNLVGIKVYCAVYYTGR